MKQINKTHNQLINLDKNDPFYELRFLNAIALLAVENGVDIVFLDAIRELQVLEYATIRTLEEFVLN